MIALKTKKYNKRLFPLKEEWFAVLCLLLSVTPYFRGYLSFLIIIPFILKYKLLSKKGHSTALWLLLFSITFVIPYLIRGDASSRSDYFRYFLPPLFFVVGGYFGGKYRENEPFLNFLLFFVICSYSFRLFFLLMNSLLTSGDTVMVTREILDDSGNNMAAATLVGLSLSLLITGLTFVFVPKQQGILSWIRIIGIILALASVYGMAYLITRTSMLEAAIMIFLAVGMMLFERHKKGSRNIFIVSIVFIVIIYYGISKIDLMVFVDSFQYRNEHELGVDTAGGRTDLWIAAIKDLFLYPFGTPTGHIMQPGMVLGRYCHNMWLDIGVSCGIIPFVILVITSINNLRQCYVLWRDKNSQYFTRLYFFATCIMFIVGCFFEPVHYGLYSHLLLYFFFCGMVNEMHYKRVVTNRC